MTPRDSSRSASPTTPSAAGGFPQAPPEPIPEQVDAVVIGSGAGGLGAAATLAGHGLSVLVLEQDHKIGGCLASFARGGYEFEVGLHYVSDWGPEGAYPRLLRAMGADELPARPLDPDGFDTLVFPDLSLRVPADLGLYRDRLVALFPSEERGIDRFVAAMREARSLLSLAADHHHLMSRLWRSRHALRHLTGTLDQFLDSCTRDPRLRAVLSAQNGIYGEPPSRASAFEHLIAVAGYIEHGAYYPAGGGAALVRRLTDAIARRGGRILTGARVTRVLVEGGRVRGVTFRLEGDAAERTTAARHVVSDADLKHTLLELVGAEHLGRGTTDRVREYEMGSAFGVVYVGARRDLKAEGVPATNYWIYHSYDTESVYIEARAGRFVAAPPCFVSLTSLKDPENTAIAPPGTANLELVSVAPSTPEAWGTTAEEFVHGGAKRAGRYDELRDAFAERLIVAAGRVLPELARDIVFREVATPLTHARYTGATGGTPYGLAPIPSQVLWHRPRSRTEIDGLYLCGASTMFGGGILPSLWSGVFAASSVLGPQVIAEAARGAPAAVGAAR